MLLALLALGGCASQSSRLDNRVDGTRLTIYVSVPLQGATGVQGRAVLNGALMAVAEIHARIGRLRLTVRALDDATARRGRWDPGQAELNARTAIANRTTIGYLGDLNSGASAVTIPVLNRYLIAQVSPASGAVGLTSDAPGSDPGEPEKYYPTGIRTFARVVPSDAVQATVQAGLQHSQGCRRTYVLDDGEVDGYDAAQSFADAAPAAGLGVVANQIYNGASTSFAPLARSVAGSGADCVLISALTESGAVPLTEALAAAMPSARIFGTDGLAESTYTDPAQGGIPLALDRRVLLTSPALGPSAYPPSGRALLRRYAALYGPPEPDAIFGYEGMEVLIGAIDRSTDHGRRAAVRSAVARALMRTSVRDGAVGRYAIESDGDTTLRSYGIYQISDGRLRFWKVAYG